jgi:hypothetical protein
MAAPRLTYPQSPPIVGKFRAEDSGILLDLARFFILLTIETFR